MTTSFLRFRMRVLSNKGHGSSCFSSFAPVASFYLLLSTLLPSSPRHFHSPPRSHTHTHTHPHARLAQSPSFPLPATPSCAVSHSWAGYFPDGISTPIILLPEGHAPISGDRFLFRFWSWIQESTNKSTASLQTFRFGRFSRAPSVPPLLVCPRRLGNISWGLVLSVFSISEQAKAQKDSRCRAGFSPEKRDGDEGMFSSL